jgi:hypothetical protein
MPGVEVGDDAVALKGIGLETFEEEFATMDGYVLIPVSGRRPTGLQTPLRLSPQGRGIRLIQLFDAAGEGDIGRFVFGDGDGFAVEDAGRGCLGGGFTVSLHESRIAS